MSKKDSKQVRAFKQGNLAFSNGNDLSDNPYKNNDVKLFDAWENGWRHSEKNRNKFDHSKNKYKFKNERRLIWNRNQKGEIEVTPASGKSLIEREPFPLPKFDIDWNIVFGFVHFVYIAGGVITGIITFIACWIYAYQSWGFLLGVGLGWIPSFFIGIFAGFLWPILALGLILVALSAIDINIKSLIENLLK